LQININCCKKPAILYMLRKVIHQNQLGLFSTLGDQLNQKHPLYILANKINWQRFEDAFSIHYSEKMGKPAKPIRLMVSLLILKFLRNLSDENLVEQWSENLYYQYFGGMHNFQASFPCVATELIAFRHRIGEAGMELILKESIELNDKEDGVNGCRIVKSIDTTVQEKNITYPTDDKLYKKIIKRCWKIHNVTKLKIRQSYVREIKKLSSLQRFKNTKSGSKASRKASKRIKTIAGVLVRELVRKLPLHLLGNYLTDLKLFTRVLHQKRGDSGKIYSLHEPHVKCYTKGKEHKKFEFGSKVSLLVDQQTNTIRGALNFTEQLHDSKTIPEVLEQYERLNGSEAKEVYVDRGYRGQTTYKSTLIFVPKPQTGITKAQRKKHSNRAAIEPIIGHLKSDYRLCRNFLKGIFGDIINVILSAAAMNFKRVMNLWKKEAKLIWKLIFECLLEILCPKLN
jgi:IS5 family transposase